MVLETVEAGGLAHLSYLIGDERAGVGAVIDPRRDVEVYLALAARHQLRITQILETHIHADFVSGSRELADRTGAPVGVGAGGAYGFRHRPLEEGAVIRLGALALRVLETPGHTPEHVCYLASGGQGAPAPWGLFTGDTLFSGEVGRPDLLGGGTEERLARTLFHTLHERVLAVGDEVEVYPAHGSGSPCGAQIGDRRTTTIGYERRHNPRLLVKDEDAFVRDVLGTAPPPPAYYPRMKRVNAEGPRLLGALPAVPALDAQRFREEAERPGTLVLDAREIEAYGGAHIAGSLNIALRESFPIWAGWLLEPGQRILLVIGDARGAETARRHLLRIGLEEVAGWLRQGMRSWYEAALPFRRTTQWSVQELWARVERRDERLQILDVRSPGEWAQGHIPGARHIFLPALARERDALDRERPVVVYCGSGYRASMGSSILERGGFREVCTLAGSMLAWRAAGYPLEKDGA